MVTRAATPAGARANPRPCGPGSLLSPTRALSASWASSTPGSTGSAQHQDHRAFHDITHGNNTVTLPSGKNIDGFRARPGWDPATGWGSPNAQVLVPLLGKEVQPGDGQGLSAPVPATGHRLGRSAGLEEHV
jgi:hypothetical protein